MSVDDRSDISYLSSPCKSKISALNGELTYRSPKVNGGFIDVSEIDSSFDELEEELDENLEKKELSIMR